MIGLVPNLTEATRPIQDGLHDSNKTPKDVEKTLRLTHPSLVALAFGEWMVTPTKHIQPVATEEVEGTMNVPALAKPIEDVPPLASQGEDTQTPTAPAPATPIEASKLTDATMSQAVVIVDTLNPATMEASVANQAPLYPLPGLDPEVRGCDIVRHTLLRAHSLGNRMQGYKPMTDDLVNVAIKLWKNTELSAIVSFLFLAIFFDTMSMISCYL